MKETKHFVGFEYDDTIFEDETALDEYICDKIGGNYNNIDPMDTNEFEYEWTYNVKEVWELDDVATRIVKDYIEKHK
jgi:hypothetical protein